MLILILCQLKMGSSKETIDNTFNKHLGCIFGNLCLDVWDSGSDFLSSSKTLDRTISILR